ncbi:META domain-containing protein [Campylobacter sp. MIT 21-1685]|uniref:META domain-containing protein n=1 Tax=unclassified Campylobacter TaxID=2593542 RepID=UPI00224A9E86|nr:MULTISPECIES: META domain-containing protein [unclassified Campylobacter]MCX2682786.1 META domain-containing protein [Campylobacter sp. MIT 21-1684]MCX2751068.1 META domain-containing protein [Campylobacter sp. MIT 21-1682]MCX2807267.1 META domain-containing protein [Campylobacter sp. MIT 21-1685]
MKIFFSFFLFSALFVSCSSTSLIQHQDIRFPKNQLLKIEKIIINATTYHVQNMQETPYISFEDEKFYGFGGCNRFFGFYKFDGEILEIDNETLGSTKMLCKDSMEFEDMFLTHFKGKFRLSEHHDFFLLENDTLKIFLQ